MFFDVYSLMEPSRLFKFLTRIESHSVCRHPQRIKGFNSWLIQFPDTHTTTGELGKANPEERHARRREIGYYSMQLGVAGRK